MPSVRASKWVQIGKDRLFLELLLDERRAAIRFRSEAMVSPKVALLTSPRDALYLLADKRLEFLWVPLTEWAGQDLGLMRDRLLSQARSAAAQGRTAFPASTTSESSVRPPVRALLQLADVMEETGQGAEAEQMLRAHLTSMAPASDGKWQAIEWFSVGSAIASLHYNAGNDAKAIEFYEYVERVLDRSPFGVNATMSRAGILASAGRYAESLNGLDAARARFTRERGGDKIPGSERQFARVRACALHGLGRQREAEAAFRPLLQERQWFDRHFVISPNSSLAFYSRVCMKDSIAVADLLTEELRGGLISRAFIQLQPAYQPVRDADFWTSVRSNPRLQAEAAGRMRVLPREMTAALNEWRPGRHSTAAQAVSRN